MDGDDGGAESDGGILGPVAKARFNALSKACEDFWSPVDVIPIPTETMPDHERFLELAKFVSTAVSIRSFRWGD